MNTAEMKARLKKYQWPMYVVVILAYILSPFSRGAPAIMGPELIRDMNLDAAQFGLLGLSFFWTYALSNAPAGAVIDKIGPRRGLMISLLLTGIGSLAFSIAEAFWVVIVGRMLVSMATAGIFICGIKIMSSWFTVKQFPQLNGIFLGMGAVGSVLATGPLQFMMNSLGWRTSFAAIAAVCVVIAVLAFLIVRSKPADVGLPTPDELAGEAPPAKPAAEKTDWWTEMKPIITQKEFWFVTLFFLGVTSSGQVIASLWGGVLLSNVYGFDKMTVADIMTVMAVGMVLGSVVSGSACKKFGMPAVMLGGTIAFLSAWVYMVVNLRSLSVFELKTVYFLIGFCQMYAVVGAFAAIRQLVPAEKVGTAVGLSNACAWLFGAGLFNQIWGLIIGNISKGATPFPVAAFEVSMWVQAAALSCSVMCAIYLTRRVKG